MVVAPDEIARDAGLRAAVRRVAILNLSYFVIEFGIAHAIGSVSLFADSVDFLEDASVNLLVLLALGWGAAARARLGVFLGALLLAPAAATALTAWHKFQLPVAPDAGLLSLAGLGALGVNGFCAWRLASFRNHGGSITRAAFLSARNDAFANIGIILAGVLTAWSASHWPDLLLGLAIFAMNLEAAADIWKAAHREMSARP